MPVVSWSALFSKEVPVYVCDECKGKFTLINGEVCSKCNRPFESLDPQFIKDDNCNDCYRWEEDLRWKGCLEQNTSIFLYNDFLQEVLARFKFRGDYILAKIFTDCLRKKILNLEFDYIVPIPLSSERLYERGFNQAEAIIKEMGMEPIHHLSRVHSEKQSKKSRSERINLEQIFSVENSIELTGKKLILIDDIYTTGSTLRHAAKALKENGANRVVSLTIARG